MEAVDHINTFQEFFEKRYKAKLLESVKKGKRFLVVSFQDLSQFNPEIASDLLDKPEEVIKAAELALESFDLPEIHNFRIRFKELPESQNIPLGEIRSKDIGKFVVVGGVIRQKSDVRPQVTSAKFECPSCGNLLSVLQLDTTFKEPSRCGCGRKGKFRLVSKELVDAQRIVLEENPEQLTGSSQPKRLSFFLKEDLVSPLSDKKTNPGNKVSIVGIIKEIPVMLNSGAKSTRFDLIIEANFVEVVEETFQELKISKEEEKQIKDLSRDPKLFSKLVESIAPGIYGYSRIKEALILQLMSGVRKTQEGGVGTRGDIHILLVGDPGCGKSQLLKRVNVVAPKGRYVSGKGVSGAGLTATVVKDEFLRGWALEAGALVLASDGIACIDEMDKMSSDDTSAMHEALEQQTISISKANVQATLVARTTVLAAANPKLGRFDPYALLAEQIAMPPTLINRFDLIFPVKDTVHKERDEKMATHILGLHRKPESIKGEIETKLLRKYIAYAKQRIAPKLTDGALDVIKDYYVKMRGSGGGEEGGIKAIPISARQLEALIRLSEAAAKTRLSDKVTRKDAKRATSLVHYYLTQIGMDVETGEFDIDRISTGVPAAQRSKIAQVKEIIVELENKVGKIIPIEEIVEAAKEKNMEAADVDESIEKLKRGGDLFEPRRGFISRI